MGPFLPRVMLYELILINEIEQRAKIFFLSARLNVSCKVQSSHTSADHLLSNEKSVIIHPLCVTWNSWLNTKELLTECHVFQATKLQRSPAVKVRCGISFIEGNTTYMFCCNAGPRSQNHEGGPFTTQLHTNHDISNNNVYIPPPPPPPPPPAVQGPLLLSSTITPCQTPLFKTKEKVFQLCTAHTY